MTSLIPFSVNETTDETSKTPEKKEHLDFAVDIVECYFDISDPASCEKKVLKPFAYYTRQGLIYSREYYKKIYNKYFAQIKKWKTQATSLASDFTHQDFTCDKGCNYFSMAKKVLHNWKSIFSGPSSMLGGFDISSAGLSFASGVVAATKSNVTEMLVLPFLIMISSSLT